MAVIIVLLLLAIPVAFFVGVIVSAASFQKARNEDLDKIMELKFQSYDLRAQIKIMDNLVQELQEKLDFAHISLEMTLHELEKQDGQPLTIVNQYIHPDKETV